MYVGSLFKFNVNSSGGGGCCQLVVWKDDYVEDEKSEACCCDEAKLAIDESGVEGGHILTYTTVVLSII